MPSNTYRPSLPLTAIYEDSWTIAWHSMLAYMCLLMVFPFTSFDGVTSGWLQGTALYIVNTVPIILFTGATIYTFLPSFQHVSAPTIWMLLFFCLGVAVSVTRFDAGSLRFLIGFVLPLIVLIERRPLLSVSFLNILLLASAAITALLQIVGLSHYGIFPGTSAHDVLWWRVSIFQFVPESAYFAGIVLILNLYTPRAFLKRITIVAAAYFLIMSGTRSGILATALGLGYCMLADSKRFATPFRQRTLVLVAISVFIAAIVFSSILIVLSGSNAFLNQLLTHSTQGVTDQAGAAESTARLWIWAQHWGAFISSPLIGIGTFKFSTISDYAMKMPTVGSESFLTLLLARFGLITAMMIASFASVINRAIRERDRVAVAAMIIAVTASLGYGSIVTTHDIAFMVLISVAVRPFDVRRWLTDGAHQEKLSVRHSQ